MTTSEFISVFALTVAGASFLVSWWQGHRSNRIAEEANAIAKDSLAMTREKALADEMIFIQPTRWDSSSNRVVFEVTAVRPVAEVTFEFMNYARAGGQVSRTMVASGEVAIPVGEFIHERGTLAVPPNLTFAATAHWRNRTDEPWSGCGLYFASKARNTFTPAE